MNAGRFLWGITVLSLGALLFATTSGLLPDTVWLGVLYLWPIAIILLGLSLVVRNKIAFAAIGFVIIMTTFFLAIYYGPGGNNAVIKNNPLPEQKTSIATVQGDLKLSLEVDTGAIQLDISPMNEQDAKKNYIVYEATGMNKVIFEETRDNGEIKVRLSEKAVDERTVFTTERKLSIRISPNMETSLVVNAGASKLDLDLSKLRVSNVTFNSGAVSSTLKIGSLVDVVTLSLQSGASDYLLLIPTESGISVTTKSGLSNLTLPNGKSSLKFEDFYKSDGFDTAKNKVKVDIRTGLTNVKISNY